MCAHMLFYSWNNQNKVTIIFPSGISEELWHKYQCWENIYNPTQGQSGYRWPCLERVTKFQFLSYDYCLLIKELLLKLLFLWVLAIPWVRIPAWIVNVILMVYLNTGWITHVRYLSLLLNEQVLLRRNVFY